MRRRALKTATDSEVIAASAADPEAFRDLFERHFPVLVRYLRRRVGKETAEDLAVETFVLAFRRRRAYDHAHESARPWLFGIATNLLRHHRRSESRRLLAFARTGVDPIASPDHGFEEAEDRAVVRRAGPAVARALAALRPEERDVLLLYAWGDLTYAEVAAAVGVPVGTVRSRLARARGRLRELLAASGQLVDGAQALPRGPERNER
jgi:RNA polymerase sigma factor (sigma-70 family)